MPNLPDDRLWRWIAEFPADARIGVLPGKIVPTIVELLKIAPDCAIHAHAGDGVIRISGINNNSDNHGSSREPTAPGEVAKNSAFLREPLAPGYCDDDDATTGYLSPEIRVMRAIKERFDPKNTLIPDDSRTDWHMTPNGLDNLNEPNGENPAAGIDYELFLRCIHCGLCTSSCPTFTEVGDENDGPRGRIQLMRIRGRWSGRAVRPHAPAPGTVPGLPRCETACPSGVHYGRLIEPFRLAVKQADRRPEERYDWFRELVLFRLFPYAERMHKLLMPIRLMQRTGLFDLAERMGLLKLIPGRLGRMVPLLPPPAKPGPRLPKFLPAVGRKRARVAFFVGCVADAMFRPTHWATLRVLQQNGCDVFIPPEQGCCGAIHFHAGDSHGARLHGRRQPRGLRT